MLLLNILLALVWIFLSGDFSFENYLFGLLISFIILWLVQNTIAPRSLYVRRVLRCPSFVLFFLKELLLANLRVTFDVLTPRLYARPGVVGVPLTASTDIEITLFANLISLTPGSLSLDISADRKVLYVHVMYLDDEGSFIRDVKEHLETRLLEVLR